MVETTTPDLKPCNSHQVSESSQPSQPPKKRLKFESSYLRSIPLAKQYEKSFMHRDVVTHVFATPKSFIITASQNGNLKFWKKKYNEGIEFVKHYRCHLSSFSDIAINHNGSYMATCCGQDQTAKIFDVINFDMINILKLDFAPRVVCWVHQTSDLINALAISDSKSGKIYIFDAYSDNSPIHCIEKLHGRPVILMQFTAVFNIAISMDEIGMIEYWSGPKSSYEFPTNVRWEYKTDTDLYEFFKIKQIPVSLIISPNGRTFSVVGSDHSIYIFDLYTAKIIKKLDETLHKYVEMGKGTKGVGIPMMEWSRKLALEKEMSKDPESFRFLKLAYDFSSNFLIFPTPLGINVYSIEGGDVVRQIGTGENLRFVGVALCNAIPSISDKLQGAATTADIEAAENPNFINNEPDPLLVACAYKKNRFYLFTNVEPYSTETGDSVDLSSLGGSRDIFNEKPMKEDMITALEEETPKEKLSTKATIYTTYGDIHIELYPDKCQKTVENFCTLAKRGYYNGHTFHRVIKSFMIQTGDPTGRGTGGQSIWGEDFEDEFHPSLRHDKAFRVSMANAGPNTNGSQFFITVCPAEWLDGKNTLFGQVTEGCNVVQKINQVPTYEKTGRPREDISIISITLDSK